MDRACPKCKYLLKTGDRVKATVISRYQALKSKVVYALEKPTECLHIEHDKCPTERSGD